MTSSAADSQLRKQAMALQFTAVVVVVAAVLNILRTSGVFPFIFAVIDGGGSAEGGELLRNLITVLPVFFYAAAVGTAGRIFGRVAKGEIFSKRNSAALGSVGGGVMFGAASAIVATPLLLAWVDGARADLHLEPANGLLIVIGGLIQMLGFVHARATSMSSALDRATTELNDFI